MFDCLCWITNPLNQTKERRFGSSAVFFLNLMLRVSSGSYFCPLLGVFKVQFDTWVCAAAWTDVFLISLLQQESSHGYHLLAGLPSPLHPPVLPPLLLLVHAVSEAVHVPESAAVLHGALRQDRPPLRSAQHWPPDGWTQADGQLHYDAEAPWLRQHDQPGQSSLF